jgi:hypothetical protein
VPREGKFDVTTKKALQKNFLAPECVSPVVAQEKNQYSWIVAKSSD